MFRWHSLDFSVRAMSSFSKYGPPVLSAFAFIMFLILVCWWYLYYKPRRKAKKAARLAEEARKKADRKSCSKSSRESSACRTHQSICPTRRECEDVYFCSNQALTWQWTPYHAPYCIDIPSNVFSMNLDETAFSPIHVRAKNYYSKSYVQASEKAPKNNTHTLCKTEHQRDNLAKGSCGQVKSSNVKCLAATHSFRNCNRLDPCTHGSSFHSSLPCIQELAEGDTDSKGNTDSGYED